MLNKSNIGKAVIALAGALVAFVLTYLVSSALYTIGAPMPAAQAEAEVAATEAPAAAPAAAPEAPAAAPVAEAPAAEAPATETPATETPAAAPAAEAPAAAPAQTAAAPAEAPAADAAAADAAAAPAADAAAAPVVAAAAGAGAGDAALGLKVFAKCKACHKVDGKDAVGPHLNGVVGRPTASVEGFKYSDAMIAHAGEWTPERIDAYLADPKGTVPGNKMAFAGLKKPEDRANVIAYLQSLQ